MRHTRARARLCYKRDYPGFCRCAGAFIWLNMYVNVYVYDIQSDSRVFVGFFKKIVIILNTRRSGTVEKYFQNNRVRCKRSIDMTTPLGTRIQGIRIPLERRRSCIRGLRSGFRAHSGCLLAAARLDFFYGEGYIIYICSKLIINYIL